MWSVILTTYNLPPWLCMKESSFMLTLLIPGHKSPGKDIDVYMRPLIEDLKVLWDRKGVETIDVASGQKFNMRAMVLWIINDFPARSSLSGWSGQGYKACPTCNKDIPFVHVLSKTAYVDHRRFLKKPHKWRNSREFNGQTDNRDPPKESRRDEILAELNRLPTRLTGKHPIYRGVKIKRNVLVELNWTKRSIFYELEYWCFLTLRHNLDIMHIEKNVLEAILNNLLMNDKSNDTAKARQDLQRLGIRSGLWLGQTKNGKCLKPQAAYCFTPEDRKKFCQFIKGVKLPDGFGSCFKHKVTDNDTNITGLKSRDCHIMMQRLLPYGLQNYLPDKIAKPIIELCSLFKQICYATLIEDDMLIAQIKVVDILCDFVLIYPPALFDIMIHLVIHLPLEALEGGPIRRRWLFPFERYMKKLKGYVRNKAKPEGSIAEGYVAEEALTFSSHYFRDAFQSVCKSIGLRSVIRFDAQELEKVKWYVLHIDTYRSRFKSLFPNKDMKEEFPEWFGSQIRQRHVDNDKDPEVSTTSELFALACGPTWTPISINSCVVDGVRYVVHSRDERRTTQNSGICAPGPDEEMYYGQLQEILEFKYLLFKVVLFRVKWFDTCNQGRKVKRLVLRNNMTQIDCRGEAFKNDQYILVTQVKQVFYLEDKAKPYWRVVEHVNHKKFSDGGVIVVEDDPDIIHFDNSSDLPLSTNDDITDDGDALPRDLADSDDEDLINDDDDSVDKVYSTDVARSNGGDGGGEDHPPPHHVPSGCMGCFANQGKGPVPITFERGGDKQTLNPLGPHAASWSNYIGEVVRSVPLYHPSWEKVPKERNAAIISDNSGQEASNQAPAKAYNTNKASFKARYWKADPTNGTLRCGGIRRARLEGDYSGLSGQEEMRRLVATGQYTEDEDQCRWPARGGRERKVRLYDEYFLEGSPSTRIMFRSLESVGASGSGGRGDDEEGGDDEDGEDEDNDDESRWGLSLGKVSQTKLPQRTFPSDMSLGKTFPSDMLLGKGSECRQGRRRITFKTNLDTSLSNLPTTDNGFGFYNLSTGQGIDRANSVALCRGDINTDVCLRCLRDIIANVRKAYACPNSIYASAIYEYCTLIFNNDTLLGNPETREYQVINVLGKNSTNVDLFYGALRPLMEKLRADAS
ncbi:hypothetical protein Tco_1570549, partial [Tanacetum coccineum]